MKHPLVGHCNSPASVRVADGVALGAFANSLKPGSVRGVNKGKIAFMQMENISKFLKVRRPRASAQGMHNHANLSVTTQNDPLLA